MRRFRIGATSFVYPAGWLANVERLARAPARPARIEDVELLFFDPTGPTGLPDAAEFAALRAQRALGLGYSVHTPLSASLASEDEARRCDGVSEVLRILEFCRPLEPDAYVIHVYHGDSEGGPRPSDLSAFRARATRSLEAIVASGVPAAQLCVEYLDYDLDLLSPVIEALDLSVALDVGHLLRDGRNWREILKRYLPRTKLVQWHGTAPGGRDHKSLAHVPRETARALIADLIAADYRGVLTLEVFNPEDFEESLSIVNGLLAEHGA
ncbi:MAG TPA: cobamide remodeling phosphodiesterase CbiR [Polyangiales bacterium]|nr:cobamide remodeling phosphodiesterase CbiR [Polyangiales bacterium]